MSAPTTTPRPLLLLRGGTRPDDVARLGRALAERLEDRGLQRPGPDERPDRRAAQPLPLIVPIGPREDPARVRADLARRLDPQGPGTDPGTDLLLRTSGSTTGTGRLVAMSAAAMLASARATHERLDGPGHWVLALPAHHVAGLQVILRSLIAGGPLRGPEPDRGSGTRGGAGTHHGPGRPQDDGAGPGLHLPTVVETTDGFDPAALAGGVTRALAAAGPAPVYTSLVPAQLLAALAPGQERAAAALARLGAVLVGGAAADAGMLRRARDTGIRVVTTYGMSETAGGCVYDGLPLEGVQVRLRQGRILLSGPTLFAGYAEKGGDAEGAGTLLVEDSAEGEGVAGAGGEARDGARTAGPARAVLPEEPPVPAPAPEPPAGDPGADPRRARRWLATTDRGRLEPGPDGRPRLIVEGRLDDIIITGGIKVDPARVEAEMTALPGVAECCVLGLPDPRWGAAVTAVVVPEPQAAARPGLPEALRRGARQRLDGAHAPKRVVVVEALPRLGPGKVDRRALAARLGAGGAGGGVGSPGSPQAHDDERTP